MKEKLVEEWLIRARERGGIDQAYGQWLISQGHQILWFGHSRTEFGKDITTADPEGRFHAYQIKDEDIDLKELRNIHDQIKELVEIPIVHPRVPPGSPHLAHLVTSGLFNEVATLRIRAMNEGWTAKDQPTVEIVGRNDLIPLFVVMSDAFWPEKPADIRDFFSFYLAEGRGDFDPKKFSGVLRGLLPLGEESVRRKAQRLAAVGLLANYLLNPFEREGDHWSLFRGWTMVAANQAWFANKVELPESDWRPSFNLAKEAAKERLVALSTECLTPKAFAPQETEFDDYTRTRNLILASVLAATDLLGLGARIEDKEEAKRRLEMLLADGRLFAWGESAVPHLLAIQWYAEKQAMPLDALPSLKSVISTICERNHIRSEDECFPPPMVSPDEVLADLFSTDAPKEPNRRCPGTWSLEALIDFLARRNHRDFLTGVWREISHLDLVSFQPRSAIDGLLWQSSEGHEAVRKPAMEQSWSVLVEGAREDRSEALPEILREDREFALMFLLAYPHRLSRGLIGFLDQEVGAINGEQKRIGL